MNPSNSVRSPPDDGTQSWRKHGRALRSRLLLDDEDSGGGFFALNSECRIELYFDVADRLQTQFAQMYESHVVYHDAEANLTQSYLVGQRLVKFRSIVLPTHDSYFSNDSTIDSLRAKSQAELIKLLRQLEQLALLIDQEEFNRFILTDLDPKDSADKAGKLKKEGSDEAEQSDREGVGEETGVDEGASADGGPSIVTAGSAERRVSEGRRQNADASGGFPKSIMHSTMRQSSRSLADDIEENDDDFFSRKSSSIGLLELGPSTSETRPATKASSPKSSPKRVSWQMDKSSIDLLDEKSDDDGRSKHVPSPAHIHRPTVQRSPSMPNDMPKEQKQEPHTPPKAQSNRPIPIRRKGREERSSPTGVPDFPPASLSEKIEPSFDTSTTPSEEESEDWSEGASTPSYAEFKYNGSGTSVMGSVESSDDGKWDAGEEDNSILEANSIMEAENAIVKKKGRRVGRHFKGCVKCLLE